MSKPTADEFIETLAVPVEQLTPGVKAMLGQLFTYITQYGPQMEEVLAHSLQHPSIYMRPELFITDRDHPTHGNRWCAVFGVVAGFGDSPVEAMKDFDRVWYEKLPQPANN